MMNLILIVPAVLAALAASALQHDRRDLDDRDRRGWWPGAPRS
ncbi:MAG: hypothetical protein ABR521_00670 [Gaiellaceae bacterium]